MTHSMTQLSFFDPPRSPAACAEWTDDELAALLADWVAAGWLRPFDAALADWLKRQVPTVAPIVRLLAVLVSHQAGAGQVCLDLSALAAEADALLNMPPPHGVKPSTPQPATPAVVLAKIGGDWRAAMDSAATLIAPATQAMLGHAPFVRDGDYLYLRRFWQLEQQLAVQLLARLGWRPSLDDAPVVQRWLARLFPADDERTVDQRRACALALGQQLTVIMGGPGTGKTTTVLKILILLQAMAVSDGKPPLRMALCAPTGKAAARLRESISGQTAALLAPFAADLPELRDHLPQTVTTLHRLIGLRPDRPAVFDEGQPLALDVLVIDEASMIGAGLMAHTLAALAKDARLILLGDAGQLSSVEPGAVLGDLAAVAARYDYHPITRAWLEATAGSAPSSPVSLHAAEATGLPDACLTLHYSHRFGAASALGQLAAAVNAADVPRALSLFGAHDALCWRTDDDKRAALLAVAESGIKPWLARAAAGCPAGLEANDWAISLFVEMRQMQLLCALRDGAYGVAGVNDHITGVFSRDQVIAPRRLRAWYAGRPILVTQNDAALGLANGDVGLILAEPVSGALRAVFYDEGSGAPRWLNPERLPAVDTAFALTVHKAQGSEYAHSVLILPPTPTPVLTRELVYTALTRARAQFTLIAADTRGQAVFSGALARQVRRSGQLSGLLDAHG